LELIVVCSLLSSRLISDVVTGKIDVCGVTVPKFEVVEGTTENELLDDEELTEEKE
jgi:hypothetical protein